MGVRKVTCPWCGASFDLDVDASAAVCPYYDSSVSVTPVTRAASPDGAGAAGGPLPAPAAAEQVLAAAPAPSSAFVFTAADGTPVAAAIVPEAYRREASVNVTWQSEMNPLTAGIRAVSPREDIILISDSREICYDVRSAVMKMSLGLIRTHTDNGTRPYVDAEKYVSGWAEKTVRQPLTAVAKAVLPSPVGMNRSLAEACLDRDIGLYELFMGAQPIVSDKVCEPVLLKYEAVMNGRPIVVFAGAEFEAAWLSFREFAGMGQMADMAGKAMTSLFGMKNWFAGPGNSSPFAGFFGNAGPSPASGTTGNPSSSGPSGDTAKHVDFILFGAQRKYLCMAVREKEKEAESVFLQFVSGIRQDPQLDRMEEELLQNKMNQVRAEAAASQAMAQQSQMRLAQLQQQTTRMLAENSRQISAGIMDSWDRRQAAESRISSGFSEAVRGVDTYVTPTGETVEARVSADHVYQNKYGDVINVFGNAPDDSLAARLDWTKLERK